MTEPRIEPAPLPWTGERYLPDVKGNIELEHVHRYLLASRLSLGKRVLDIACGEGYGSSLLAQSAASVVGVDIAAEAVAHARARYPSKNLTFEIGSASAIPLPDGSVDVVVSFETIEHHHEHDAMMREIKRVLVPGGVLVISSPDRLEYSDKPGYANPYHVKELYRAEFAALLRTYFRHHHMSGQRIVYGSAIFNEDSAGRICSFGINDKVLLPAPGLARALYLVAVASDGELPLAESGLLEQPIAESDDVLERHKQIVALSQSVGERDGRIASLDHAIAERDGRIADLGRAVAERDGRIVDLDAAVMERHEQIEHLVRLVAQHVESIANLGRDVAAADAQVAGLADAVADRDAQIAALARVAAERGGQIAGLDQALAERDGQIAHLGRLVAERGGQVAQLEVALAERDARITRVEQVVAERDARIDRLVGVVTDRDEHIADLAAASATLDAEITALGRSIAERDERIAVLEQTAAGLDGRIADLLPVIAERDGRVAEGDRRIADLHEAVAERDRQLHVRQQQVEMLLQSRSWRWTKPLRLVTGPARSGLRSLRGAFAPESTQLPLLRQIPIRRVRRSPLFDPAFYALQNPDVHAAGIDPATHYAQSGWREHRDASAQFSTGSYLQAHPDVAAAGINPLLHYSAHGRAEGRRIAPAVAATGPGSEAPTADTRLAATVDHVPQQDEGGAAATPPAPAIGRGETPLDARDEAVVEAAPPAVDRLEAEIEDIERSGMFDAAYYLAMYPDLQSAMIDPLRHYCEHGWREGRNPSEDFNTRGYLGAYGDIRVADINPFWHYVVAGALECRQGTFDAISRFEDEIFFGRSTSDIRLVAYYATPDWRRVKRANKAATGQRLLPHDDIGFYDASDADTLARQATMARRHGVGAWCFSLDAAVAPTEDAPLSRFLATPHVDLAFCLDLDLRLANIDPRSIACLQAALGDPRSLKLDGRPLLIMTLPEDDGDHADVLRALETHVAGPEALRPYRLARFDDLGGRAASIAGRFGCEGLLDLPIDPVPGETGTFQPLEKNGVDTVPYTAIVSNGIGRIRATAASELPVYRAITLGRDDSPIHPDRSLSYSRFHLKEYRRWLGAAIADTRAKHRPDRRLLFINAWNDWNRGAVLEPDRFGGYGKLNETSRVLLGLPSTLALPKVTVIVPNFNHATYLPRRLESIYRQTYRNIEVLLLDDCSTDRSRAVLAEYADRYPDFTRLLFNERNSGSVFRQWAKGIAAASGSLIWIAESDDYCDENFLEKLVRCFDDEAVMLAYSKVEFVRADESIVPDEFSHHVRDLACRQKWNHSYVNTAHHEVGEALGIINTIPNASGAIFRRPVDMDLLESDDWLSMAVVGDWVFYLHLIRGGKIAYSVDTTNYFRRYEGSTAASTYHKEKFYRELSIAAQTVQILYDVPGSIVGQSRRRSKELYDHYCASSEEEFMAWFDEEAILAARTARTPNLMVSTMGFHPGGAEILPIRIANELKRMGHSVLLLSVGLSEREDGVRRMLRNDVPVIETPDIDEVRSVIREFGIEVLNSHQWHVQKYPALVPDVYRGLKAHVASLHGMIEHGHAFGVTSEQIHVAHENVSTWVYTADKNLGPFIQHGLYEADSPRFAKLPNGMAPPKIVAIPRFELGIPEDAFVLCCVSRAIPDKGWAEAIEAVAQARDLGGRDVRLILVGNGPVHDEYLRTGVPDFVYLAGFSDNSVGFYAAADMGIMLTRFRSESFPLTIVDCLFAGRPYLSCDVGEIRNMLTDEGDMAGAIVPLVDWQVPVAQVARYIVEFSTDARRYADALAVVPKLATRYGIDRVVERYVEIFRDASIYREPHRGLEILATTD